MKTKIQIGLLWKKTNKMKSNKNDQKDFGAETQ